MALVNSEKKMLKNSTPLLAVSNILSGYLICWT